MCMGRRRNGFTILWHTLKHRDLSSGFRKVLTVGTIGTLHDRWQHQRINRLSTLPHVSRRRERAYLRERLMTREEEGRYSREMERLGG